MQIAITITEPDVKLQRLAQPQRLIQAEPQQHPVCQADSPTGPPPAGRLSHLGQRGLGQIALEAAAVGQNRFGCYRGRRPLGESVGMRLVVA